MCVQIVRNKDDDDDDGKNKAIRKMFSLPYQSHRWQE